MSKYISLSHLIEEETFCYGGEKGLGLNFYKKIANKDSSNNSEIRINTHISTHIDFPYHFCENGSKLEDFESDFFVFEEVEIVELNEIKHSSIIEVKDLAIKNMDCEILLIKTNFEQYRKSNIYWEQNPGISPDVAEYLRKNCPKLRGIGFDFISISPFQNRELGRKSHREFLCDKKPILIIEDMKLKMIESDVAFEKIIVSPLLIKGLEASPVTVLGVLK